MFSLLESTSFLILIIRFKLTSIESKILAHILTLSFKFETLASFNKSSREVANKEIPSIIEPI